MRQVPTEYLDPAYVEEVAGGQPIELWISDRYECTVRTFPVGNVSVRHLSINREDRRPVRNWRHLQQIKNEVCGGLWTGVEYFPPEDRLIDSANQYHLFCFPPEVDFGPVLGAPGEGAVTDDAAVARWNSAPHKGRQEPWEKGLTTGRTEHSARARRRATEQIREDESRGADAPKAPPAAVERAGWRSRDEEEDHDHD
jgi:hypothetical protein